MSTFNQTLKFIGFLALIFLTSATSFAFAESSGQYIDDATITTKVKEALFANPKLKVLQITVESNDGTVLLRGVVDTTDQETEAVKVAGQVKGVHTVTDNLATRISDDDDYRYGNH